jgi:protein tyrosine phosphatase (PTP) superfamily phosphohydrolase (DUF442 family)
MQRAQNARQHTRPADQAASGGRSNAVSLIDHSARGVQLRAIAQLMRDSAPAQRLAALAARLAGAEGEAAQRMALPASPALPSAAGPGQQGRPPNRTGLPDRLKSGIETLAGLPMDHVRVHYRSSQPAQLHAHAFAQGSDIHLAPGQERHLPHEAWHVVQQAQGRVRPTLQMKGGVTVNDDAGLEREADLMGARAIQAGNATEHRAALGAALAPAQLRQPLAATGTAKASSARMPLQQQRPIVQRTAWEKHKDKWERRDEPGAYEKASDNEKSPPPASIGEEGWLYSSNTMTLYENYKAYFEAVRPDLSWRTVPPVSDQSQNAKTERAAFEKEYTSTRGEEDKSIKVTDLEGEDKLLGNKNGKIKFKVDVTHNYLLWSVPKYTGLNLVKEVTGKSLEELSGEAAAEKGVKDNRGYMMKQTKEHMEALTALSMIQSDEGLTEHDILGQYGKDKGETGAAINPKKIDPLHNPRDPDYQSKLIEILKLLDVYYDEKAVETKKQEATKKLVELMHKEGLKEYIQPVMNIELQHKDLQARNAAFHHSDLPSQMLVALAKLHRASGARDHSDEVTRAILRDPKHKELHIVGGRQAIFDSIWGPKSDAVVRKAATRLDSVQSHGLAYHWNPKTTVQARYEFPPYRELLQKTLKPVLQQKGGKALELYNQADTALGMIIENMNNIEEKGKTDTKDLPEKRKNYLMIIEQKNIELIKTMHLLREILAEKQ